jgi:hypothetical protein
MTDKSTSDSWFSTLYLSLGATGLILMIFSMMFTGQTSLSIVAYSTMMFAVGMIATHIYLKVSRYLGTLESVTLFSYLYNLLLYMGPVIVYLAILILSVVAFVKYKDVINQNRTSSQYYTFSGISSVFVVIEFVVLWLGITSKPADEPVMSSFYRVLMYLLASINLYAVIIMWYILTTYTTDGFSTLNDSIKRP